VLAFSLFLLVLFRLSNDVTDVDAYAETDTAFFIMGGFKRDYTPLNFNATFQGGRRTGKFRQKAIASSLDQPTAMLFQLDACYYKN
jgi:hypothetical protein